ncbi:MAG: sigma-54 dependent transcriptional regulator [Myxococcota bacterium]
MTADRSASEGRVLIVDDEGNMRRVLAALVRRDGFDTIEAANGVAALEKLENADVDVVLTDLKMPQMNGLELLAAVRRWSAGIPVIMLTAHGTVGSAVEALKCGAFDFLTKPFEPDEIRQVVAKAIATRRLEEAETSIEPDEDPDRLLLGSSCALRAVKQVIERVAPTAATVLIGGESGTGKELVARSLHLHSERREQPFVKVNCAAIPEGLIESELFGHEKGAFTGAASRKPGRFELADGGSLFLDEIGEMPASAQPKLLRAIQEGRFFRVGGTHTISVDVRIVAASNRDLREEVRAGRFREDLFYRLNVVPISLPPLRERREDIADLATFFLRRFAPRVGRELRGLSDEALAALARHDWPGNIRELENAIERATVLSDGPIVALDDLPAEISHSAPDEAEPRASLRDRIRSATRRIESEAIAEALAATHGNVTRAAEQLGLSRRGLQLKMKELNIGRD